MLALLLAVVLALVGCDKRTNNTTITGPFGQCSTIVVINGKPISVSGDRSSTVSVGSLDVNFGPDCSVSTTDNSTRPAPPAA